MITLSFVCISLDTAMSVSLPFLFPFLLFPHNAYLSDVLYLTFFFILSYFIAPSFLSASDPLRIQFRLEQIDQTTIGIEPTLVIACFARPKI